MQAASTTAPILPNLLGAILLALVVHGYLWRRLARGSRSRVPLTAALALLGASWPATMLALLYMRSLDRAIAGPILLVGFTWAGMLFFLLPLLFVTDGISSLRGRRVTALPALVGAAVLSLVSLWGGARAPRVHTEQLAFPELPRALEGYRIAHVSDVHVGALIGRARVEALCDAIARAQPDLVVLTGDVVDGSPDSLAPLLEPLRALHPRDGVYLVLGNHEHLSDADAWAARFPSLGVSVLRNASVRLREGLELVGLDDAISPGAKDGLAIDYERAFAGHDGGAFTIALVHEPHAVGELSRRGVALQLSGHTHGGQIFPLHLLAWWTEGYLAGVYRVGGTLLYVSPGVGYWGPPMRLGSRAELSVLVLSRR